MGIISHSGSVGNILARIAPQKGIRFSKVVSLGNECDLNCADFLLYLGGDPETDIVGAYLEGIKDGPLFLKALKKASHKKPVIVWKLGLTAEGQSASASHTGALAGSGEIWDSVVRQGGAIPVVGFEAWVDTLMGFYLLPHGVGDRLAIISGPGGLGVSAAEACGSAGLRLAKLSQQTLDALARIVPPLGTSLRNPIDVGLTASMEMDIYSGVARAAAADPGVDAVVVVGSGLTPETNQIYTESMIRARKESRKPFMMIKIPGFDPTLSQTFCQAGVPMFDTAERAMQSYAMVRRYHLWRNKVDKI